MSDFVTAFGDDLVNYIVDEKTMTMFKRLKEIEEKELHKPIKESLPFVIEYDNIMHDIKGEPRRKFIIQSNPQSN